MLDRYTSRNLIEELLFREGIPDDRDIDLAIKEVEEFIESLRV